MGGQRAQVRRRQRAAPAVGDAGRQRGEGQVGRRVVEHARQRARGPEELPGLGDPEAGAALLEERRAPGTMVTKTPTKTTATSRIGAQVKRLASWTARGVVASDSAAKQRASRAPARARAQPGADEPRARRCRRGTRSRRRRASQSRLRRALDGAAARSCGRRRGRRRRLALAQKPGDRGAQKSTSSAPLTSAHGGASRSVQVKGTPRRKPRNSGGSPSGVSRPPPLETMKMKKTTM